MWFEYLLTIVAISHKNDMFRQIKEKIIEEIGHDIFVQNIFHQKLVYFKICIKMWKTLKSENDN